MEGGGAVKGAEFSRHQTLHYITAGDRGKSSATAGDRRQGWVESSLICRLQGPEVGIGYMEFCTCMLRDMVDGLEPDVNLTGRFSGSAQFVSRPLIGRSWHAGNGDSGLPRKVKVEEVLTRMFFCWAMGNLQRKIGNEENLNNIGSDDRVVVSLFRVQHN